MAIVRFESIGAFVPPKVVTTPELMAMMVKPQPIDVVEITGIRERRMLEEHESSLMAAESAARNCLSNSSYSPEDIDVVISCSISRSMNSDRCQYFDPTISLALKKRLGLKRALTFDISNACAGMMTGVHLVLEMIKAGVIKNGLVVSGEQISAIAITATREIENPWDPQFGSLTVGDSGAAILLDGKGDENDHIDYIELTTCAEYSELCIGKPSDRTPQYGLYTNNAEMHKQDRLMMWPMFQKAFMEKRNENFADMNFDFIIQHQVGLKFVDKVNKIGEAALGVPMPPPINYLQQYGNTATTSHFFVLHAHLREHPLEKPTKILFVPAASGLITGCMSATITSLRASA